MSTSAAVNRLAIVAIGCRFPHGASAPDQFWRLLCEKVDAITEIPAERFDIAPLYDPDPSRPGKLYARRGGFVDDVATFDAEFFGISPREAARMDPQQRLLLEVVWEALEDGGLPADRLAGSNTGVFVGLSTHDYYDVTVNRWTRHLLDAHSSTGTALSIVANRVSYVYDLRGPSVVVDTACSSSLTAVHLACRSLNNGECDLAIAGGVNVFLTPEVALGFCRASMLSPDGRCKAFDAGANGFVRSEGAGVIVLKPLERALADGDRICAVVRGSAINQDGRTVGITVPSADAQEALIRNALRDAGLEPDAVQYIEAHGTGTPVGDPIEASAIGRAFSSRLRSVPLVIGSVKTNIGHLEAAAGIAGVIKTALALEHRTIPPSLHFQTPNPVIPFETLGLRVATTLEPWPVNGDTAVAAVNSFGFGGANAHVVLEEPPRQREASATASRHNVHILPLSARHPDALKQLARSYRDLISRDGAPPLADLCYSAALRRSHHVHRAALVGGSREEFVEQLDQFLTGTAAEAPSSRRIVHGRGPKTAFVFTGTGPQWWGMGRELLHEEPVFRNSVEQCDRVFRDIAPWRLLDTLTADEAVSRVQDPDLAPVTNLVVQMGLVELWRSWGILPDAIVGHSAGEIGAACAAGALSLADALRVAFHRGRLQYDMRGAGTMLSVGVPAEEVEHAIEALRDRVSIAAINSPTSVTLSGEREALEQVAAAFARQHRFNRFVPVDVPYHSPALDPLRDELLNSLAGLSPGAPAVPLMSTVSGTRAHGPHDSAYWFANVRQPVRFADAINQLIEDGCDVFLEVGPHPVLATSISECLSVHGSRAIVLPTLRRHISDRRAMLGSLAAMYRLGQQVEWSGVCGAGRLVPLPRYPWQRERHWLDTEVPEQGPSAGVNSGHPLLGYRLRSVRPCWETDLARTQLAYLHDHIVEGTPVFPAAAYVEMALAAAPDPTPAVVENLSFHRVLALTRRDILLQFLRDAHGSEFEIHSTAGGEDGGWILHASGRFRPAPLDPAGRGLDLAAIRARCVAPIPPVDLYTTLDARGLRYQGVFRGIEALWSRDGESLARICLDDSSQTEAGAYRVHPALLDSAFQALLAAAHSPDASEPNRRALYLPQTIRRVTLLREPGSRFWSYATVSERSDKGLTGTVIIVNDEGEAALRIEGLHCRVVDQAAGSNRVRPDEPTYRLVWEPQEAMRPSILEPRPVRSCREVAERLQATADRLAFEQDWENKLRRSESVFDGIVAHLTRAALVSLGWQPEEPLPIDAEAFGTRLSIAPRHHRLLGRLLDILRHMPALESSGGSAERERQIATTLSRRALAEHPDNQPAIDLLWRSGEQLDAVLTGQRDAREVLFAPAAISSWARFFADLPWYEYYNRLVAEAVAVAIEQIPTDATLRVLEIGAGTGGTTLAILPRLAARAAEYHFTDVSAYFLAQARERFRAEPRVRVQALDIEVDPLPQIGDEPFDIVLAANVLHATPDLRATLRHAKQVLAPGGLLVLLEGARKMAWADLIFGITEGWWRFADVELRPDYPLMDVRRWQDLLAEVGFEAAVSVSEPSSGGAPLQAVLLATRPAAEPARSARRRNWLVYSDSGMIGHDLVDALRSRGHQCVTVARGTAYFRHSFSAWEIAPESAEDASRLLDDLSADGFEAGGVIHLWSLDAPPAAALSASDAVAFQRANCGSVAALVQAFESISLTLPPIWLVTAGAQTMAHEGHRPHVAQAPMWGFGRVLISEYPTARCQLVDLGPTPADEEIRSLLAELEADDVEEEIALRGADRYVSRLRPVALSRPAPDRQTLTRTPDRHAFHLDIDAPGNLETLTLRDTPAATLGPGEIRIRVLAAGLNFRDVMLALGMLPPLALPGSEGRAVLGGECAGIVMECGAGVAEFQPGDEVMAIAFGSLASQVTTRAELAVRLPGPLTLEQAATIPIAFVTAHYALNRLARLSAGERVLIHAATGGVGLAAIQLARQAGAEIYATAGSPQKRACLHAMGIEHVMDSRSLAFADEVIAATGGEGVDVIVNSLAGEAISSGLAILRPYGRFVELGKRDIHADTAIGLQPFVKNLSFFSVALDRMYLDRPAWLGSMLQEIAALVRDATLQPIPHTAFALSKAQEAFRFLGQAKHIGKIVLTVGEPSYRCVPYEARAIARPDATYVITGGLGGFGLAVARWLVDRGARHLVLMSRSGKPLPENRGAFDVLQSSPARIVIFAGDVSREADVQRMLDLIRATLPPLRGVVHAAMVLEDALIRHLSPERLQAALEPKVAGAWNLHTLTEGEELDFFVMFSSIASLLGTAGQANYAAANSFMDALAAYRQSLGLAALTVALGGVSDVGYVARHGDVGQQLQRHGMEFLTPTEALRLLENAIRLGFGHVMVGQVDWQRWAAVDPKFAIVKKTRRLAHLASTVSVSPGDAASEAGALLGLLAGASPDERLTLLQHHIQERVGRVLGMSPKKVDPDRALTEMGLDSLMAVQIKNSVESDLEVVVPIVDLLQGRSVTELAAAVLGQLESGPLGRSVALEAADPDLVGQMLDELERVPDEEARRLLAAERLLN